MAFNPRAPRFQQQIADPPPPGQAQTSQQAANPTPAPVAQPAAAQTPAAAPAPVNDPNALWTNYYRQILERSNGQPLNRAKFEQMGLPIEEGGLGLGPVKEIKSQPQSFMTAAGLSATNGITVEYTNGLVLYADTGTTSGDIDTASAHLIGYHGEYPGNKTPAQVASELQLQDAQRGQIAAQARLDAANAAKQEALNKGGVADKDLAQLQANIDGAKAQADLASKNSERISAELAANTPAVAAAATQAGAEAGLQNASANSQQAATGQARLGLDAQIAENDRKFKEGQIDNATHTIVANWLLEQWKADNANTQTVLDAGKTGYNGQETDANRDATIANARLSAANQGFSDDARTTSDLATWMMPGSTAPGDLFMGLQGLREATARKWGGMKDIAHPDMPGNMLQLGYNTPVAIRSLGSPAEVEAQAQAIQEGRGLASGTVAAPTVTPGTKPTLVVPTAPPASVKPNPAATGSPRPTTGPGSPAAQSTPWKPPIGANGQPTINPATGEPTGLSPDQNVLPASGQGLERSDDILTLQNNQDPQLPPFQMTRAEYIAAEEKLRRNNNVVNATANPNRPDMHPPAAAPAPQPEYGPPAPPPEPAYAPLSSIQTPVFDNTASQGNLDQSNRMLVSSSSPSFVSPYSQSGPYDQGGRPRAIRDLFIKKMPVPVRHAGVPMAIIDIRPHR